VRCWNIAPKIARQIRKLLKRYGVVKGRVLELGCGNGRITSNLAKLGFSTVGVDISPLYIEDAKKRAVRMGVKPLFFQGDIRKIDRIVRGKFDVAISIWTSLGFYDVRTDEILFKKVARLLRKNGLFFILFTMSRERLNSIFCQHLYDESEKYIVLNKNVYDKEHSIIRNTWTYFKKVDKNLMYEDEFSFCLHIYAIPDFVRMAENAGMILKDAFHSLMTLEPLRNDSPANLIFQKTDHS